MVDHTLEAHFIVDSSATTGRGQSESSAREARVIAHMVQAIGGPDHGNLNAILLESQMRFIYRAVLAMHEALAREAK